MSLPAAAIEPSSDSVGGFALRHRISRRTVYALIASGELVARNVRGRTVITSADEAAWLAALPKVEPATA